ncbi:MAG: hypothetical protein RIQ97_503 [Pseudomonadota bacterium]|jgi:hypothetical protein
MSTRLLLVIAHFFKPDEKAQYSSTNARMRQARAAVLEQTLAQWRSLYDAPQTLDIAQRSFVRTPTPPVTLDVVVLVNADHHLLSRALIERYRLKIQNVDAPNPRMLPFAAHRVMANLADQYDVFVYSEDDLLMLDAQWLHKRQAFEAAMGPMRLMQANRYELNPRARCLKTYVDGDLVHRATQAHFDRLPDQAELAHSYLDQPVPLVRARNPHAGFFALSARQLRHWMAQPHFMDLDSSFISPLESAASLGLLKTFSIYKPAAPMQSHFEIRHLDTKFSSMSLPEI